MRREGGLGGFGRFGNGKGMLSSLHSRALNTLVFYILEVTKVNIWHRKKVDFRIFVFCFQLETTREVFR